MCSPWLRHAVIPQPASPGSCSLCTSYTGAELSVGNWVTSDLLPRVFELRPTRRIQGRTLRKADGWVEASSRRCCVFLSLSTDTMEVVLIFLCGLLAPHLVLASGKCLPFPCPQPCSKDLTERGRGSGSSCLKLTEKVLEGGSCSQIPHAHFSPQGPSRGCFGTC